MQKRKYYNQVFIFSMLLLIVSSCNPEDGEDGAMGAQGEQGIQGEQGPAGDDATLTTPAAYGTWEVISEIGSDVAKYVYINEDNTIEILSEDQLGFKRAERTNVTVSDLDIAFDGTYLLGLNSNSYNIEQINPIDFNVEGIIPTTHSAYAVEIEKSDAADKQLFQSSNGSQIFHSYIYSSNTFNYTSLDLGAWIYGIASIVPGELWAAIGPMNQYHREKFLEL